MELLVLSSESTDNFGGESAHHLGGAGAACGSQQFELLRACVVCFWSLLYEALKSEAIDATVGSRQEKNTEHSKRLPKRVRTLNLRP